MSRQTATPDAPDDCRGEECSLAASTAAAAAAARATAVTTDTGTEISRAQEQDTVSTTRPR